MAKHKTAELEGALLDAAVAICEGEKWIIHRAWGGIVKREAEGKDRVELADLEKVWFDEDRCSRVYLSCITGEERAGFWLHYSGKWDLGGPIIERERIMLTPVDAGGVFLGARQDKPGWLARHTPSTPVNERGQTALIAAMRAYVAAKLGDEVELPGLIPQSESTYTPRQPTKPG